MDTSYLCRGCMQELHSNETEKCDKMIAKMFSFCTKIEISEDNDLPQKFCSDCLESIESSYKFIIKALQVQKKFEMLNEKSDEKFKSEPDSSDSENDPLTVFIKKERKEIEIVHDSESFSKDNVEQLTKLNKIYEERKNICKICGKDFKLEGWLKKHMVKEHSGHNEPGKYKCNYCSRSYNREIHYMKHMKRHTDNVEVYSCEECKKGFTNKALLKSHSITHMKKQFECNDCGNRFKTKFLLRNHIKMNHVKNATDRYLCAFCGKGFKKAAILEDHLRIHTGVRPLQCDECKATFRTQSSLYQHKLRHKGVRGKECQECSKRFYSKADLLRHMRTHTGDRPYKCPQCPRAFTDSWHRKAHMMRAHHARLQDIPRLDREGRPVLGYGVK